MHVGRGWAAHMRRLQKSGVLGRLLRVGVTVILCSYACHVARSFLDLSTGITYIHRVPEGSYCAYDHSHNYCRPARSLALDAAYVIAPGRLERVESAVLSRAV